MNLQSLERGSQEWGSQEAPKKETEGVIIPLRTAGPGDRVGTEDVPVWSAEKAHPQAGGTPSRDQHPLLSPLSSHRLLECAGALCVHSVVTQAMHDQDSPGYRFYEETHGQSSEFPGRLPCAPQRAQVSLEGL